MQGPDQTTIQTGPQYRSVQSRSDQTRIDRTRPHNLSPDWTRARLARPDQTRPDWTRREQTTALLTGHLDLEGRSDDVVAVVFDCDEVVAGAERRVTHLVAVVHLGTVHRHLADGGRVRGAENRR